MTERIDPAQLWPGACVGAQLLVVFLFVTATVRRRGQVYALLAPRPDAMSAISSAPRSGSA